MASNSNGTATPDNRRFVLLKRAPQLSRQQMLDHWRTTHATLIIHFPEFWRYTSRYLQNHVIGDGAETQDIASDGVVETWQRKRDNPHSLFADEAVYRTEVRADERTFLSMPESVAILTEVKVVIDGPEWPAKMLSILRRHSELSHEEFAMRLTEHAALIRSCSGFCDGLVRYVQCLCIPQMERGFAGEKPTYGIDAVIELRFASREALQGAFSSADYQSRIRPEERKLFYSRTNLQVEEIEIHEPAHLLAARSQP
jgi:hypothetical protein